jgi:hypothetical protein
MSIMKMIGRYINWGTGPCPGCISEAKNRYKTKAEKRKVKRAAKRNEKMQWHRDES